MSIRLMTEVWDKAPYKQSDLLILLALADSANDEGVCWPSVATLAKRGRVKDRKVQKTLVTLETDGWLRREKREGRSTIYTVIIPENPPSHRTLSDDESVPQDASHGEKRPAGRGVLQDGGVPQDGGGVSPRTGGGVPQDTQNRKEPSSESSRASPRDESPPIDFDSAWLGLVWRPAPEAMAHAAKNYPTVDLYAATVAYIEFAQSKGYALTNGWWMKEVKRQHDFEHRREADYDQRYDETVERTVAEATRKWNEARGITA